MGLVRALYPSELCYSPKLLSKLSVVLDLVVVDPADYDNIISVGGDYHVIFSVLRVRYDSDTLANFPSLLYIVSNTTSIPHIAPQYHSKTISLAGNPLLTSVTPTAELSFCLAVMITRPILKAIQHVSGGHWGRWNFSGPKMLSRMSVGIVGYGRLGRAVANIYESLGCQLFCYDPYVEVNNVRVQQVGSFTDLANFSDLITLHADVRDSSIQLVNKSSFQREFFLVNTARSELVNQADVVEMLESGQCRGYATDVLEGELQDWNDVPSSRDLVRLMNENYNVIVTPHIGGSTLDAWHATQSFVVTELLRLLCPQ